MMNARTETSKAGKYGTLHLFELTYTDETFDGAPSYTGTQRVWRYSEEHARDAFFDAPDADGWRIVKVRRVRG